MKRPPRASSARAEARSGLQTTFVATRYRRLPTGRTSPLPFTDIEGKTPSCAKCAPSWAAEPGHCRGVWGGISFPPLPPLGGAKGGEKGKGDQRRLKG